MKDYNHQAFMDTISPEYLERHKRGVAEANRPPRNSKPVISKALLVRVLFSICILALIVAGYFGLR